MGVYLRAAALVQDEDVLVTLSQKYLPAMNSGRFRWLYRENPFGPARVWLAFDGATRTPVGMAAVFPRRGYVAGAEVLGCVLGDFCISEKYRSLGPAVQLQRACLSLVKDGEFAFYYDFPSSGMLGVYRYLGIAPTDQSVRMIKLLKADAAVRRFVPLKSVSAVISGGVNQVLALRDVMSSTAGDVEYRLNEEPRAEEYSDLAMQVGTSQRDCILRTPDYLNWRYRQHPSARYELLAAYRAGKLLGYCVFEVKQDQAGVVDVFSIPEEEIVEGLLSALIKFLRARGVSGVGIAVLASDPRLALLKKLGFWSRESVPVISSGGNQFLLMHGDRES